MPNDTVNFETMNMETYRAWLNTHQIVRKKSSPPKPTHSDVTISVAKAVRTNVAKPIHVSITNQKSTNLFDREYWTPLWVPELERLYIVYGTKDNGYKVRRVSKGSYKIVLTDAALCDFLENNDAVGGYDFHADPVSRWYYIDFKERTKKHEKD